MKIIKTILVLLIAFTAIKTNISMLNESQGLAEVLGMFTADVILGVIINYY